MEPPGAATYRFASAASPWPVAATVDERAPPLAQREREVASAGALNL